MTELNHFNNYLKTTDELPSHITHYEYLKLRELPKKHYEDKKLPNKMNNFLIRRDTILIDFMWETGGRIGDLVKVKKTDIDFDNNILHLRIKKTSRKIRINLTSEMVSDITKFYMVFNKEPFQMTRQNAWSRIKKYGQMIGIKLHPHMFRHGLGLFLLGKNININIIASRLGHTDPRTTSRYYLKVTPEIEKQMLSQVVFR